MADPLLLLLVGAILGLIIGLLGGGGGILAVPLLLAMGEPLLAASTTSLVVVGTGAAAALVPHHRAGRVDWRIGLIFGGLGAAGAVLGARLAPLTSPGVLLGGLALLLLIGSVVMLRRALEGRRFARVSEHDHDLDPALEVPHLHDTHPGQPVHWPRTVALASAVGLVTGLFGVGAGFLVVPALVSAMHVSVRRATATALVVIVMNSAVAFVARQQHVASIAQTVGLALATALFAVAGALLSRRVPSWVLAGAFGSLMLLVGGYTVVHAVLAG